MTRDTFYRFSTCVCMFVLQCRASRKSRSEFGETFARVEPTAALVPIRRRERHLRALCGGKVGDVEGLGEIFELGGDGRGDVAVGELPEEDAETLGAVLHFFALGGLRRGGGDARVVKRSEGLDDAGAIWRDV